MIGSIAIIATTLAVVNAHMYYVPKPAQKVVQRPLNIIPVASAPAPVYRYIPPSPLAPACPIGYTCCGNLKHYDPKGTKRCCGAKTYTPSLQSCSNGNVISIVQAVPPPATTPPPVYVQRQNLICDGVAFQVPYPNYKCCGPTVYNVMTEVCDADKPDHTHQPPPPPTPQVPSNTKILICQGHSYAVPAVDFQFYACCGHKTYFWIRQQCVNGQINPPTPTTTTTSATPVATPVLVVCDGAVHWIKSEARQHTGCCGTSTYDIRSETCRKPVAPSPGLPTAGCPQGFICCDNYPPVENGNGRLQCCPNIGPFDPSISNCPTL